MNAMRATLQDLNPAMREQAEREIAAQPRRRWKKRGARGQGVPGNKIPASNVSIARLRLQLRAENLSGWAEEYRFHPDRGWRFDFARPWDKIAVEVEGLTHKFGRHQRVQGYTEDCKKYTEAVLLGWRLIRVTPAMVRSGLALEYIKRALKIT